MKATLQCLLLTALIATLGWLVCAEVRIRTARAATVKADAEALELRTRAAVLANRTATPQRVAPAAKTPVVSAPTPEVAASPAVLSSKTLLANHPAMLAAYMQALRDSLAAKYGGMFKALRFPAELAEQFQQIAVASEQRLLDLRAAAETKGVALDSPAYQELVNAERTARAKQEQELLGELKKPCDEYLRLQPMRDMAQRLASIEIAPYVPLSADHVERVTRVLAQHAERGPDGDLVPIVNWESVAAELSDLLTATQLADLRRFTQQRELDFRLQQLYARAEAVVNKRPFPK